MQNLKLFLQLYYRPAHAMSDLLDQGSLFCGALLATVVAVLLQLSLASVIRQAYEVVPVSRPTVVLPGARSNRPPSAQPPRAGNADEDERDEGEADAPRVARRPLPLVGPAGWWFLSFGAAGYYTIALTLALLYVPASLLVVAMLERGMSLRVRFERDYAPLLVCTLMIWAAAHLPPAIAGFALPSVTNVAQTAFLLWLAGNLYFGVLMVLALRAACGINLGKAALVVGVSWLAMSLESWIFRVLFFSPFLTLIWVLPLALGAFAALSAAHRQRRRFRHHLEVSTINPRDAEAHYQLGLLHQQRRQYGEATTRFRQAVEIDPRETDAHFQLGRIAREEGRLPDAINHFSTVVSQDDKHAHSEIWREIGATYLAASMYDEACSALERYIERRSFDPEGLYYLGETYQKLGDHERAREVFRQCVEAVNTMPYYRRGQVSRWSKLAQEHLKV